MIQIISDPACNLSKQELQQLNVLILPYTISYQGKDFITYTEYDSFTPQVQLQELIGQTAPVFSRPPLGNWKQLLEPLLQQGDDILYIAMSQKSTGS